MLAKKDITGEYEQWKDNWYHAQISKNEKERNRLIDELENNMVLVGATAVEDKLQENVGETITFLKQAGIKIWLLTGDKISTAVNIAVAAGLIDADMDQVKIDEEVKVRVQKKLEEHQNIR